MEMWVASVGRVGVDTLRLRVSTLGQLVEPIAPVKLCRTICTCSRRQQTPGFGGQSARLLGLERFEGTGAPHKRL